MPAINDICANCGKRYGEHHGEECPGAYGTRFTRVPATVVGAAPDGSRRLYSAEKADAVNHPSHYTAGKVECIDALEAATTGLQGIEAVCTANAIKYLWRWKQKGGKQDLEKARWYINRLLGEEVRNA